MLVGTHVDDLFVLCNKEGHCLRKNLYETLSKAVTVTNDGEIKWALKARIDRDPVEGLLMISQELYINEILGRFGVHGLTHRPTQKAPYRGLKMKSAKKIYRRIAFF